MNKKEVKFMSGNDNKSVQHGGIGFSGALFITFLVLKLTGVIDWSWIWIFAPLWISAVLIIVAIIIGIILMLEK